MTFVSTSQSVRGKCTGKQNQPCFGHPGCREASQTSPLGALGLLTLRPVLQATNASFGGLAMPKATQWPLLCAFCCFPPASPALASKAGKQKPPQGAALNHLISQRKPGAGEGIRTLDPNLGNGLQGYAPGYPGVRQTTINRLFSIYWRRHSPPSVSPDIPRLSSRCLDSALEGGIRVNF